MTIALHLPRKAFKCVCILNRLGKKHGVAFASTPWFLKVLKVSRATFYRILKLLEDRGYIKRDTKNCGDEMGQKRKIFINSLKFDELFKPPKRDQRRDQRNHRAPHRSSTTITYSYGIQQRAEESVVNLKVEEIWERVKAIPNLDLQKAQAVVDAVGLDYLKSRYNPLGWLRAAVTQGWSFLKGKPKNPPQAPATPPHYAQNQAMATQILADYVKHPENWRGRISIVENGHLKIDFGKSADILHYFENELTWKFTIETWKKNERNA